jgi:hypothetical protein
MTALMLGAKPLLEMAAPKFHAVYQTLDAFAEARMKKAVPASQLRNAQRGVNRSRRLVRADRQASIARLYEAAGHHR